MAKTKTTTWKPAWAVRYDGAKLIEYRVSLQEDSVTVLVAGETTGGGRWGRAFYDRKFGATRQEAIEKFRRLAEQEIELAADELRAAEALLARALALAAEEPPEQVQ